MTTQDATVAVIGGGVTGLYTAHLLGEAGAQVRVYEATSRVGGQLHTTEVGGVPVDVGAEAMHLGAPGAADVIGSLGLTDSIVTARPGKSWIVTPKGLRRFPAGVGPAGPTKLRPVLSSGVMTVPGLVRAGLEPILARAGSSVDLSPGNDRSVGDFVAGRFGSQVVDRFVDPLLGSLHAGDVRRLSLRATAPSLVPAAQEGRSLVAKRPTPKGVRRAAPAMSFVSWADGLSTVAGALAARSDVRTDAPVDRIERLDDGRYRLHIGGSDAHTFDADAVVLAVPSHVATTLLSGVADVAAATVGATERASVATVVLAYPRHVVDALPAFAGTGVLVPSTTGSLLKAATFLSTKWPHLDRPDLYFVRLSAGRAGDDRLAALDDDALVTRLSADLKSFIGLDVPPAHTHVQRWPAAMPQLTVGHPDRLATARADLPSGLVIAGASYDGIGIASCLGSARRAVTDLTTQLDPAAQGGTRA